MNTNELSADALKYKGYLSDFVMDFGPKLIGAIIVLIIGLWVIKMITKGFDKLMVRSKMDDSLRPFLMSLVGSLLKLLLGISIMGMLGIEMTSFIAILAAAGLAVGMALSGTLQNFAGGVMILIFKPFKVGDFIDAQGHSGTVKEIQIFVTFLTTPDNVTIIIPNGGLSNGSMTNYSSRSTRRVDWTVGVAYGESVEKVRAVIRKLIDDDPRIDDDPASFIKVGELADSSVNFTVRGWVKSDDYWDVFFDMNEKIYTTFEQEGMSIPFPQMDVHVNNIK
ncbi:MAG: mechanosensitive ion channel [Cyclobacteriaceae bacterium]|nr:mechanosensitive ion channel [Cyclobacteriaceae bacterium]